MTDKQKQAQVEAWKKQGHTVLEVPFDDGKTIYVRTPNRQELKLILAKAKNGPVALAESYVTNCLLGGDLTAEEICSDNNTGYIASVAASIDDLLGTKKLEIKKL
jgi:hypothetical protein